MPRGVPDLRQRPGAPGRFVKAVHTVWKHLIRDPLIYDLVEYDSSDRNEEELDFVY